MFRLNLARCTRHLLAIYLAICTAHILCAQNVEDIINNARAQAGTVRVEALLNAAEVSLNNNLYDKAFDLAKESNDLARKHRMKMQAAKSLNIMGKSLLNKPRKKGLFRKESPEKYFEQSNDILDEIDADDTPLYAENEALLERLGDNNDASDASTALAPTPPPMPEKTVKEFENIDLSKNEDFQRAMGMLNDMLEEKGMIKSPETAQAAKRIAESGELQAKLAEKEAALSKMTEGQMKVEYLLLQQRQLLDSLLFRSSVDSLLLSNQNLALREAKAGRNTSYAIAVALLLLCGGTAYSLFKSRQNTRLLAEKNHQIGIERERSEQLLLNVLPAAVATELKQRGTTSAQYHENVSVLFADFANFTQIAERITPQQLVSDLDSCFKAFDGIMAHHGLEKIKTIGDAYLCAGGLQAGHAQTVEMVNAARDMQQWLSDWNQGRAQQGLPTYHARIGIHQGPVVAGVVGAQKFAFDIWGDTVNIAARIEQAGEPGRINLSEAAHTALNGQVSCEPRGHIPAKNKGEIEMFFVRA
jgi:adenylate cyclase